MNDPTLLRSLIAELEGAIDQAPPGESRWSLRTYVADALRNDSQPERALPFYTEAAGEAEAAENWSDVAWITGNWADAVRSVGDREKARRLHLRSAEARRREGDPEVHVIGRELEAPFIVDRLLKEMRDGQDVYSRTFKGVVKAVGLLARLIRVVDIDDQVEACRRVFAGDTRWTVVRGSDLEEDKYSNLVIGKCT